MQPRQVSWLERPIGSNRERVIYLLGFAVLVAARLPNILLHGRFWAEEGNVFFLRAWTEPWWKALLDPYGGYLDLVPNIGAFVARHLLPLSAAPYGTSLVAFMVQSLPALLILTSRQDWLQSRLATGAALLLVAAAIVGDEVWLSSIGCTAHLALATGLILALDVPDRRGLVFQGFVLMLAALTAPGSWLLAPLFLVRAAIERSKGRALQGGILLAGVAIQLLFFYAPYPDRHIGISPSLFGGALLAKHVLVPFLGPLASVPFIGRLASLFSEQGGPLWPLLLAVILFVMLGACFLRQPKTSPLWLLLAAAAIATIGYAGGVMEKAPLISVYYGGRYAFAGQVLIGFALLSWRQISFDWTLPVAKVLVAWLLVVDLIGYFQPVSVIFATGPSWRAEVRAWRQDPRHELQLWPPGWSMRLPPEQER